MNTVSSRTLVAVAAAILPLACLASVGCGGDKPPVTPNTATAPAPTTPAATSQPTTAQAPTNVSISDEIRTKCGIPDADAYFQFDSSHVTSADRSPLALVAKCFTSGPLAGHGVKLIGRADPRGESDYNLTLGQSRADAVAMYLDGHGMDKAKTESTSRGAMDATGSDESGWQHDRRVDVMLGD